jgi:nicotinate phosphoribosyltransferase
LTPTSLALLTDLYQLSMGQAYFDSGIHEQYAAFNLYFRKPPFGGGYAIAGGIADAVAYVRDFRLTDDDLHFLMEQTGNDGKALFSTDYLNYLRKTLSKSLQVNISAVREGSVVFPNEPLLRVEGALLPAQLLETALLNIVNFQTLVATKASRVVRAAEGKTVLEFGLRRAQGVDGGLTASKAAYLGGCHATSNVLAGKLYGIPVKGTHAHSMVMAYGDEAEAFRAYARSQANNLTFLVDTYDTLEGVRNAIKIAKALPVGTPFGVRLDSGDLAALSKSVRALLNANGFMNAKIVASSDLDEYAITKLNEQGAEIDVYGVGTNLVTCSDQPALGGVYKLVAIQNAKGVMEDRIKVSENSIKTSIPGRLNTVRYFNASGTPVMDMLTDPQGYTGGATMVLLDGTEIKITEGLRAESLMVPVLTQHTRTTTAIGTGNLLTLAEARTRAATELAALPEEYRALTVSKSFPVGLERNLYNRRAALIAAASPEASPVKLVG